MDKDFFVCPEANGQLCTFRRSAVRFIGSAVIDKVPKLEILLAEPHTIAQTIRLTVPSLDRASEIIKAFVGGNHTA